MGWIGLATVLLKIVKHFLDNKTPEAKKAYVDNLEKMSNALVTGDTDAVNDMFFRMRDEAREGDPIGFGVEEKPGRDVHGDSGVG